jgi:hypothetical protein
MWPTFLDASGCVTQYFSGTNNTKQNIVKPPTDASREDEVREGQKLSGDLAAEVGAKDVNGLPKSLSTPGPVQQTLAKPAPIMLEPAPGKPGKGGKERLAPPMRAGKAQGHELGWGSSEDEHLRRGKRQLDDRGHCVPQGLKSPPFSFTDTFTLGGMADSLYEYLPKVGIYN